jgi:hypothetical protein
MGFTKPASASGTTSYRSTLVSMAFGCLMSSSIFASENDVLALRQDERDVDESVNPLVQPGRTQKGVEFWMRVCYPRREAVICEVELRLLFFSVALLGAWHFFLSSSSSWVPYYGR